MKYTIDELKEKGLVIYEYVRGSTCQGTNTPTSDIDLGGVYVCPNENLLGLGYDYEDEISDEKHDVCYWELNKYMKLLLTSNPTVLESLFVDDEFVRIESPLMTEIKKHRNMFLTKECFKPFFGYATSQIAKARGLNKKIVNPIEKRLWPLDFCYTNAPTTSYNNNGSTNMREWLDIWGLKQSKCGLQAIENMPGCYNLYYDYEDKIGYKGIVGEDGKSDDVRCSSIPKGEKPICIMYYNLNAFQHHCKEYKDYQTWVSKRNPIRYESNLNKNYDAKNMAHCFRLVQTAIEIAQGKGYKVNRKGIDADFLLDIKSHKFEYDYLINLLEEKKEEMNQIEKSSTIPDKVDREFLNDLLLKIRTNFNFMKKTKSKDYNSALLILPKMLKEAIENDPVRKCKVFKKEGCAHVDGMLCDYPNCSILKNYKN